MQKLAILYDASQAVLSTFDLDEVLRRILTILRDYFQVQHSTVLLLDEQTNELSPRIRFGWPEDVPPRSSAKHGVAAQAAAAKHPIYLPDVRQAENYVEMLPGTRAELAIPLMVGDRVVGVLDCHSHRPHCFDEETIDLLTLFSTQASIALRNAKLHELERRRAAQLELLNAVARQTAAVSDLKELLRRCCDLLLQAFKVDHVAVLLLEDNRLVVRAQYGRLDARIPEGGSLPVDSGPCGRALATRAPVLTSDVGQEPDYIARLVGVKSELCLPLLSFRHSLGVLTLSSAAAGAFSDSDVGTLESVADIFAGAIQNAIHFEQIRQLAYRDGLTGIFNRRFFELRILEELERAKRYELAFSVLMIDLDGLKALNDEFGHLLGDEALRQISSILGASLRKADVVCRYGGDEFAVLLPETAGENALRVADKLRRSVCDWEFPGVPRPVSISIGAACFPQHGRTRDVLVKAADDALYRAKQAGRNRLLLATLPLDESAKSEM
ncbi:MAG: diguanylate cyclase [Terriglobales bacterium]